MDDQMKQEPAAQPAEAQAAVPADEDVLKAQCDEYLAGWKRAMADYANLKKESERAQAEFAKFAAARLATELLPVLDRFRKAFAPPADGKEQDRKSTRLNSSHSSI